MSRNQRTRDLASAASRRIGLSVGSLAVAMVACAFAWSAPALAVPVWQVNGTQIKAPVTVSSKGTFRLTQEKISLLYGGGSFTAECASGGEDIVGGKGEGEIRTRAFSGCKVVASTSPYCTTGAPIWIRGGAFPWHTHLGSSGGTTRDYIEGVEINGECGETQKVPIQKKGSTSTAVTAVAGGVDETFDSQSEGFSTWSDGANGRLEGTSLLESPGSGALTYELAGEWLTPEGLTLVQPQAVNSSGSLRLKLYFAKIIGGGGATVECKENGKGTLGPLNEGEVAGMSLTGCQVIGTEGAPACHLGETAYVNAVSLPWHTYLYTKEGITREYGYQSYEIQCGGYPFEVYGNTSMGLETTPPGVNQLFDEKSEPLTPGGFINTIVIKGNEFLEWPGLTYRSGS